jgi:hypothetical protein
MPFHKQLSGTGAAVAEHNMLLAGFQCLLKYMCRHPDPCAFYPAACFFHYLQGFLVMEVGSCSPHGFFRSQY